jgi:transposase-like protein
MRKIYRRSERAELLAAVKRGEPVPNAARRLGVTPSTAYRWVDRSKGSKGGALAPLMPPTFIEVMTAGTPSTAILVRVGAAEIEVRAGFDASLLRAVVAALDGGAG